MAIAHHLGEELLTAFAALALAKLQATVKTPWELGEIRPDMEFMWFKKDNKMRIRCVYN